MSNLASDAVSNDDEPPSMSLAMPSDGLNVQLILEAPETTPPLADWFESRLIAAMREAGVSHGTLNVLVLDDAAMGELHDRYHGDPLPTDVLTFDLRDDPQDGNNVVEGDIAVCVDVAAQRSAERQHPVREELLLYAVHGLLHLLGEDDHDPAAFDRMHAREDAILTAIGVGPRFAPFDEGKPS
ncbi:MAG: rRNA maturation RNase YbeY [Algisphaera sp.]